jgi:hypothetical protein
MIIITRSETRRPIWSWRTGRVAVMSTMFEINVNMTHGNQLNISNWAVVAVRPTPRLITGRLLPTDAQAVFDWRDPTSIRLSPTGTVKSARYKWPKHRSDYRRPLKVNRDSRNRHRCFKRNQRTRGDRVFLFS